MPIRSARERPKLTGWFTRGPPMAKRLRAGRTPMAADARGAARRLDRSARNAMARGRHYARRARPAARIPPEIPQRMRARDTYRPCTGKVTRTPNPPPFSPST
ncbi:hypothetical protein BvRS1_12150 [Burkholderia vietnamiensis]|nr:hypothetical protein BvRS1_12150 [Burkholderia vietnamiensis]